MKIKISGPQRKKLSIGCRVTLGTFLLLAILILVLAESASLRAETVTDAVDSKTMVHIVIQPDVRISAEEIYLKDIARIQCEAPLKTKIGRLELGPAPRLGKYKTISGKRIASFIRSQKWIPEHAQVDVPERVTITRSCQTVSEERLKQLLTGYIQSKLPKADVTIRQFKIRGLRPLPPGNVRFTIEPLANKKLIGRVNMKVGVAVDGQPQGNVILSAWVDRYEKIVCGRHTLIRDTILTADDLCLQRKNISKAPANLIQSTELAVGKRLKQTVAVGAYLRDDMLENPPLIFRGDRVKLIVTKGALKVETLGVAKERGGKGEQLRAENVSSGKTVVGRVIDASTVEVLF